MTDTTVPVNCPGCNARVLLPLAWIGRRVKCKHCNAPFEVQPDGPPPAPAPARPSAAATMPMASPVYAGAAPPPLPPRPGQGWRVVVCLVAAAVCLGSWGGIYAYRQPVEAAPDAPVASLGTHACVAVESGGVRLIRINLDKTARTYTYAALHLDNVNFDKWNVPNPEKTGFVAKNAADVVRQVGLFVAGCEADGIPKSNVTVACNAGVFGAFPAEDVKAASRAEFDAAVRKACGLTPVHVTAEDEVRYGALGTLPPDERATAVYVDVGSSAARVGYYGADRRFRPDQTVGIKGFRKDVEDQIKLSPRATLRGAADGVRFKRFDPELRALKEKAPALDSRQVYHFAGGGAWVVATVTHPTLAADETLDRYPLTKQDVQRYLEVVSQPGQTPAGVLAEAQRGLPPGKAGDAARAKVRELEERDMPYLVSSGVMMQAYFEVLGVERKKAYFFTRSLHAWPLGYILVRNRQEN